MIRLISNKEKHKPESYWIALLVPIVDQNAVIVLAKTDLFTRLQNMQIGRVNISAIVQVAKAVLVRHLGIKDSIWPNEKWD